MPHVPPPLPWKQFSEPEAASEYLALLTYLPVKRLSRLPQFLSYLRKIQKPGGLAPEPPADCDSGLALYRGASLPGLAAVWLERGTGASTVIRHARLGP